MKLFPRFFYNDDATGGNSSTGDDNGGGAAAPAIPEDIRKELDELRAYKANTPARTEEKTADQIAKETETRRADFIKYSVESDLMKVDDFAKHDSIVSRADRDLVYDSWFENWKAENPDVDKADVAEISKKEFEEEFKLDSKNEKTKARGEARLQKEANEIRNPLVSTYKTAKESFDNYQVAKENVPKFHQAVDEIIKESVPDELVYKTKEGEQDITIEGVKLTAEDKKEIGKLFKTNKYFGTFISKEGGAKALKEVIETKIQRYLTTKYDQQIKDAIYEKAKGIGVAKGSSAGAANHFGLQDKNGGQQGATIIPIDNSKANAAGEQARQGRR